VTQVVSFRPRTGITSTRQRTRERAIGCARRQAGVLYFPQLRFPIEESEGKLLSPAIAGASKNISLDRSGGTPRGSNAGEAELATFARPDAALRRIEPGSAA
jgi:hypothetical protein